MFMLFLYLQVNFLFFIKWKTSITMSEQLWGSISFTPCAMEKEKHFCSVRAKNSTVPTMLGSRNGGRCTMARKLASRKRKKHFGQKCSEYWHNTNWTKHVRKCGLSEWFRLKLSNKAEPWQRSLWYGLWDCWRPWKTTQSKL